MQGMDIKSVANRLGHKNCGVTHKIYAAVTNEMKVKNAEKMDEFFAKMARDESFRIDNLRIWELNLYPLFGAF